MKKAILLFGIWYIVISILIIIFYNMRVNASFGEIRKDTLKSTILKEQIGDIKKIKYNVFPKWINNIKGYDCVMFKVYTKDNKYQVCSIIKGFHATGYIIDNQIYMEEGS